MHVKGHRQSNWCIIACFIYLRFHWWWWNLFSMKNNGISFEESKHCGLLIKNLKKNSDQQTAVFIKLVTCHTVMSYSIIFFRGSLRLRILSHVVTAMNDSAIEGYKCHLVDTSSIRSSRITVKTDTWSQQICKMLAKLGSEAHPRQNAELKIPSTPLNYSS